YAVSPGGNPVQRFCDLAQLELVPPHFRDVRVDRHTGNGSVRGIVGLTGHVLVPLTPLAGAGGLDLLAQLFHARTQFAFEVRHVDRGDLVHRSLPPLCETLASARNPRARGSPACGVRPPGARCESTWRPASL